MVILVFIGGVVVGCMMGILVMCMAVSAGIRNKQEEKVLSKEEWKET